MSGSTDRQFRPAVEVLTERCLLSALGAHHHPRHPHIVAPKGHFKPAKHVHHPKKHHHPGHGLIIPFRRLPPAHVPPQPSGPNHSPPVIFNPNTGDHGLNAITPNSTPPGQDFATMFG